MKDLIRKLNQLFNLKDIASGILMFGIVILISIFVFKIPLLTQKTQPQPTPASQINVSTITKESIQASKQKSTTLDYDTTVNILDSPIQTPPFVTNPDKLRDYLGKVSRAISVSGAFENAYLFIKSGEINIQNESIYFYIVDGITADGHLYPKEALLPVTDNIFIYDLKNLPLEKFPYSLDNPNQLIHKNVVNDLFNIQPINTSKIYYIGAFVSTTKLPNQIISMEIRYKCKTESNCSIQIQN